MEFFLQISILLKVDMRWNDDIDQLKLWQTNVVALFKFDNVLLSRLWSSVLKPKRSLGLGFYLIDIHSLSRALW